MPPDALPCSRLGDVEELRVPQRELVSKSRSTLGVRSLRPSGVGASAGRSGVPEVVLQARSGRSRQVLLCYCETVKNITVSVPEDVYRNARIGAAERDSSVSAIVTEFLAWRFGAEFRRLETLQRRVQGEIDRFSAGDRLGRDELHARAVR